MENISLDSILQEVEERERAAAKASRTEEETVTVTPESTEHTTNPDLEKTAVIELPVSQEEDDVKIAAPKAPKATLPPEETATRVVNLGLSDEEIAPKETPSADNTLEQALQKSREKQIEHFRQTQETGGSVIRLVGEDEERNDPDEEPVEEPKEVLPEELRSYEDGRVLLREMRFRRTTSLALAALTVILELILGGLALVTFFSGGVQTDIVVFWAIQLVLFGMMMVGNHSIIGDGWRALLRGEPNAETLASCASILVLIHTVLQLFAPAEAVQGHVEFLTALAGFQLLVCSIARQNRLNRICDNLKVVASTKHEKWAACQITDAKVATMIGHNAVAAGNPLVTYFKKTPFLKQFLANAHDRDYNEPSLRHALPIGLGIAVAATVLYSVLTPSVNWLMAVTVFITVAVLVLPTVAWPVNAVMTRAATALRACGGMLSGQVAVERFGDMDGLAMDASQLFATPESIRLVGIKTFADAQIDTAILDAAAVCIKAASPLATVFRRVIEDREDYLQEVDTLVYEQELGISGWVGGRRVLIGSRQMLHNHGVDVPSGDFEQRYLGDDRHLVYLSTGGTLAAMFVVSYQAHPTLARALRRLNACGVSLLIRSCDPNITESLICDLFELDDYYVEVMNSVAGHAYESLCENTGEEEEAVLSCGGRLESMAWSVALCHALRKFERRLAIWQIIGAVLAAVFFTLVAIMGRAFVPVPLLLAFLLVWTVVPLLFAPRMRLK